MIPVNCSLFADRNRHKMCDTLPFDQKEYRISRFINRSSLYDVRYQNTRFNLQFEFAF
jgi:hypothetical protein